MPRLKSLRSALVTLGITLLGALAIATVITALPIPGRGAETDRPDDPADGDLTFTDVASEVGLDFEHGAFRWGVDDDAASAVGSGLCWLDFDDDGWLDLYAVNSWSELQWDRWQDEGGVPSSHLFRNERGTFVDVTEDTGAELDFHGQGCVAADFDGDGHTDLYVTSTGANALLWNSGDGTFIEGADAAGVAANGWSTGAAAGDVNGDGFVDLFVAGYAVVEGPVRGADFPAGSDGVPDRMFLNMGDRRFVDAAAELGIDTGAQPGHGMGGALVDIDRDRDLDLVVVNDTDPNRLYLNESSGRALGLELVDASEQLGVSQVEGGMAVTIGDHNRDLWPDLAFGGPSGVSVLQSGEFGFVDATGSLPAGTQTSPRAGLTWADFDLDGDLDLLTVGGAFPVVDPAVDGEEAALFTNNVKSGEILYVDGSADAGLGRLGAFLGRSTAAADYDNDGDMDIAVNVAGGRLMLLANRGAAGHWIGLDLGNAPPGSLVEALLPDGVTLVRSVVSGSSHLSSEDPRVLLGLGRNARVQTLTVLGPDGTRTVIEDVPVDRYLDLSS